MYYTYVLRMCDNKLYIGATNNLIHRIKEHKEGKVHATKNRRPFTLLYNEAGVDKLKCFKREVYFKTGFGRRFIKSRI